MSGYGNQSAGTKALSDLMLRAYQKQKKGQGAPRGEKCPYCGKTMDEGSNACTGCGAKRVWKPFGWSGLLLGTALLISYCLLAYGVFGIFMGSVQAIVMGVIGLAGVIMLPKITPLNAVYEQQ